MSPGSDDAETYLPVSVRQLTEALCELRDDTRSREEWKGMVASLQVVVGVYYDGISHRVREHLHEDRRQVTQKRAPADEKSKARGQAAMQDLVTLLDAAQYSPLSQELFDASVEVSYSFPFPCSIQWNRFDGSFLQEYYSRFHNGWYFSPNTAPPSFAESLLVVTRGRRIEERTGQFIWEKVNLLLEICWAKMLRKVGLGQQSARKISFRNKLSSSRVTLEDVAREDGLLNVLFRKVTIREPAFKEVIILFREKASTTAPPPDPKEKLRQFDASMSSSTIVRGSADTLTTPHNRKDKMAPPQTPATPTTMHHTPGAVTIMLFHQVPFGDLDGIFPFKNVLMRPVEILTLLGMILAAVAIIIMTLRSILSGEEEGGNMFLMQLFLLSVSRQAIALFTYITNLKSDHMRQVHEWVQSHCAATNVPVISQVVEEVKHQELKELMIAYFFLWTCNGMTVAELDARAESFLKNRFKLQMDFEVEDAMNKLRNLNLVRKEEDGRYTVTTTPKEWTDKTPTGHLTGFKVRT